MGIPVFGLGTYRLKDDVVKGVVRDALEVGYRAIDTAQIYDNEAAIGEALQDSGVARSDLFITTKIWITDFTQDKLIPSLQVSLDKLRTDYVDLVLIHWPSPQNVVPMQEYLSELVKAKEMGLTRHIGISNFTVALMQQAIAIVGEGVITTNQVEVSPYLPNRAVADFARQHDIAITSYMTLTYGKALQEPVIIAIAKRHAATPAQVVLAWALQQGYAVIPSSTKRANLQSNLLAQQLRLTEQDMGEIATLENGTRLADPESLRPQWDK